ncbi:hypothetical protein, partial [Parabacteroides caecihominis]|uniref:hypothetical protein n=1 Tax=Parabacteroides sp. TA-V-105 TaxID=2949651 RepID=UPI002030E574
TLIDNVLAKQKSVLYFGYNFTKRFRAWRIFSWRYYLSSKRTIVIFGLYYIDNQIVCGCRLRYLTTCIRVKTILFKSFGSFSDGLILINRRTEF